MSRVMRAMVVVLTMGGMIGALPGQKLVSESAEAFVDRWAATFNENDPDKLLAFYDHSEDLEVVLSAGLRHQGYAEVDKTYRETKESVEFYDSKASKLRARTIGEVAVVSYEHTFKLRVLHDDSRMLARIQTTMTLRRVGGTWRIVQEHSSPIHGVERLTKIESE